MNQNPEATELDKWLESWRDRSLAAMKRHRANRLKKFTFSVGRASDPKDAALREADWDKLNDRKNITLAF